MHESQAYKVMHKSGAWRMKSTIINQRVWNMEHGAWSMKYKARSMKSESGHCKVRIRHGAWSMKSKIIN